MSLLEVKQPTCRPRANDAIDTKQTETREEPGLFEIGEQSLPRRQSVVIDV
jgi:hypothetical protein